MPNHVINILAFEGNKAKIHQMLEDIKDDEYGLHSVDFNNLLNNISSLISFLVGRIYSYGFVQITSRQRKMH